MTEKQLKIMVVADRPEVKRAVQEVFDRYYDLTTVDSADAAVEKYGQNNFDVIITDVVLPRISGTDVISEIKATKKVVLAQKTEHLKKVREAVSRVSKDFEAQKPDAEMILRDSKGKHEIILNKIDGQMRELTRRNVQQDQQIQSLEKELETALRAKEEILKEIEQVREEKEQVRQEKEEIRKKIKETQMEKEDARKETEHARQENEKAQKKAEDIRLKLVEAEKNADAILKEKADALKLVETAQEQRVEAWKELEKATVEKEAFHGRIAALEKDLREAEAHAENVRADKDQIEKKLAEFHEHWEKYMK